MAGTAAQARAWSGPAVLSYGFRPFFLMAAVWAVLSLGLWLGWLAGADIHFPMPPIDWHAHALMFGYVPAVIAGFLLTAVPNWTGRLPVVGWPLAALAALWVAGRLATSLAGLPPAVMALIDMAFLVALVAVGAREIVAGRNWRNLPVLGPVALLLVAQGMFHADLAAGAGAAQGAGLRLAFAATIFLIVLIGGRITPSFTRNWLVRQPPGRLPASFGRLDRAALVVAAAALAGWVGWPGAPLAGAALMLAGVLLFARLARWQGRRTGAEPLVAVLHAGYAFTAAGFLLMGAAILAPAHVPAVAALHAWAAGAIGLMTLAVMTRATLGHTGRGLAASPLTVAIYVLVGLGALGRVAAAVVPMPWLTGAAGLAWAGAFVGFVIAYGPLLIRPRPRAEG
jgi:uncharacterized protein involved in response to NO